MVCKINRPSKENWIPSNSKLLRWVKNYEQIKQGVNLKQFKRTEQARKENPGKRSDTKPHKDKVIYKEKVLNTQDRNLTLLMRAFGKINKV